MHKEMRSLLNAYLDGELHGRRLHELETHLASCEACQDELQDLRQVSELLQADPITDAMPVERFVSQMTLRLPRRSQPVRSPKPGSLVWWLVPAGLFGTWIFVQTVFTLTNVVTAANASGLLGSAFTWLGGGQESIWLSAASGLFGGQLTAQPLLSLLNNVSVFGANLVGGFLLQAVIVLLYVAWLGAWWIRRQSRLEKIQNVS
jgi:anti-sigma factor RsiW